MNTSLEDMLEGKSSRMENCKQPGGDNQILLPRPLPVSWKEAMKARGVGKCVRRRGFLDISRTTQLYDVGLPIQHRLCTRDSLRIEQQVAESRSTIA